MARRPPASGGSGRSARALVDAAGADASGGGADVSLGDSAARGARAARRSWSRWRRRGEKIGGAALSALAASADSEELDRLQGAASTAQVARKGTSAVAGYVRYVRGTGPTPVAIARRRARREASRELGRSYARKLTYRLQQARQAAEVVTNGGVAARVSSVARAAAATTATGASAGGSAVLAALSPVLLPVLGIVFALFLVASFGAAIAGQDESIDGLGAHASEMVAYLRDEGWDDIHVAAAVGNAIYESDGDREALEIDPAHEGDLSGEVNHEYEVNCGIFSWTDTEPGHGTMTQLKNFAEATGRDWQNLECQLDFFTISFLNTRRAAFERWLEINDLRDATRVLVAPDGGLLAGADVAVEEPAISERYDLAERVFDAIHVSTGSGQEYDAAGAGQRSIVDAAYATPSAPSGMCATWVSWVFARAGISGVHGNACDMYDAYCTSSDRSELKVGMIIAVPSVTNGTPASKRYGHVGIYIGDDRVMHSTGGRVVTDSLDQWCETFASSEPVMWGFPPGFSY